MDRPDLGKLVRRALGFCGRGDPSPAVEEEYDPPRVIAIRTEALCAQHGPHEIAAAVGAPPEVEHPRFIAYLMVAAAELPEEARELAVEAAVRGFKQYTPAASS